MLRIEIPQRGSVELQHAVFDVNGTLAIDGMVAPEVIERVHQLSEQLNIHLLTADTYGNSMELERSLGFPLRIIIKGEEKMRYVQELGPSNVVAIGNGNNDAAMLRLATIGIAVIDAEGVAGRVLQAADVLVKSPVDALDLLLHPKRLIATLRG